jgi:hypothetical protein
VIAPVGTYTIPQMRNLSAYVCVCLPVSDEEAHARIIFSTPYHFGLHWTFERSRFLPELHICSRYYTLARTASWWSD